MDTTYRRLMTVLAESSVDYRVIDHPSEGNTERASKLRGHEPDSAAKCLVVTVRAAGDADERTDRHVLAVVPGTRRVDYRKIRKLYRGSDAVMAERDVAEALTGCRSGCIIPFSFEERLSLVLDPDVLDHPEVYFNAARLDRSIAVSPGDLVALARPRIEAIAK